MGGSEAVLNALVVFIETAGFVVVRSHATPHSDWLVGVRDPVSVLLSNNTKLGLGYF